MIILINRNIPKLLLMGMLLVMFGVISRLPIAYAKCSGVESIWQLSLKNVTLTVGQATEEEVIQETQQWSQSGEFEFDDFNSNQITIRTENIWVEANAD